MAGEYALNTGADLRHVGSNLLFPIAYAAMRASSLRTEEEHKALTRLEQRIVDLQFEHDTGLPAWARRMAPADQMAVNNGS